MSPTPRSGAVEEARALLRALASALQMTSLYPPDHPKRTTAAHEVAELANRIVDALGRYAVLFVGRRGFYLGPTLLARESLALIKLVEAFEEAHIEALEFQSGVADEDASGLLRLLAGEHWANRSLGAITVNAVRPWFQHANSPWDEMGEFQRGYAAGLEFVRETAARVAAERPADIDGASAVTERLADLIASDPAEALLLTTVKSYDEYTYYHMVNVCILSLAMGDALGLQRDQLLALGLGGLLHDVGKVKVPREVLQHAGPLEPDQWRLIQRHPVEGAGILFLTSRNLFHPAVATVLEHHLAFDRSGYPVGADRVPSPPARIVAVADTFDALTSDRPYRKASERRQALNILQAEAGKGFDPQVTRTFVRLLGLYPLGSLVRLSTGEVAMVIRNHERLLARPTVRLILDKAGAPSEGHELDLSEEFPEGGYRWRIEGSVEPQQLGVDMLDLLSTGRLEPEPETEGPGLVHEPAFGEDPPPGYVDAHNGPVDPGAAELAKVPIDADVAPPYLD